MNYAPLLILVIVLGAVYMAMREQRIHNSKNKTRAEWQAHLSKAESDYRNRWEAE